MNGTKFLESSKGKQFSLQSTLHQQKIQGFETDTGIKLKTIQMPPAKSRTAC